MDGISSRADGGLWTTSSVVHLLANRVHLGEVSCGSDTSRCTTRARTRPWSTSRHGRPQRERRPLKERGTPYVLSGLVRCAACRYVMAGGPGVSNGRLRVYRCHGRHGGGKCPAPTMIVADRLEA